MYGPYQSADPNEVIKQYTPLVRRIASHIGSRLPAHIAAHGRDGDDRAGDRLASLVGDAPADHISAPLGGEICSCDEDQGEGEGPAK